MVVIDGAKQFFNHFFSLFARWDKKIIPFQRGAWLRLYGIPLHAWNETFFKLCVMDCGRFLRTDASALDRERFDYARVLVATSSLVILNEVACVLVDGVKVEVEVIEEWGFNVGEDACLFEREDDVQGSESEHLEDHHDIDHRHHVDDLVEKIKEGLDREKEPEVFAERLVADNVVMEKIIGDSNNVAVEHNGNDTEVVLIKKVGDVSFVDFSDDDATEAVPFEKLVADQAISTASYSDGGSVQNCNGSEVIITATVDEVGLSGSQQVLPVVSLQGGGKGEVVSRDSISGRRRLNASCPPGGVRPLMSGPWNRAEVLKILKKEVRKRRGRLENKNSVKSVHPSSSNSGSSSVSVNKDWEHWVVMHGNERVVKEDVRGIGKTIGVRYSGADSNMFQGWGTWSFYGCIMKILSWNVRGLGGMEKKKEVCDLVKEKNSLLLCIQETKLSICDDFLCASLWGNSPHGFSFRPSVGASGGLLILWDVVEMEVWYSVSLNHVLMLHGRFIKSNEDFYLFNVYAPCETIAKQELCQSLTGRLQLLNGQKNCVCGDFNAVRADEERHSVRQGVRNPDMHPFNQFIEDSCLFVIDKWNGLQVEGWGGFVLKEKLKLIKLALKEWHNSHSRNIPGKLASLKERLAALDSKGEDEDLTVDEIDELHSTSSAIHSLSRVNSSICWQQSRLNWLREGDANTQYFHSVLASRRRRNSLSSVTVDDARRMERPEVDGLQFSTLSLTEGGSLIKPFSVEEVKAAVWDCDSYKSPGPDGINFGFLKEFWNELQVDLMRFISEFHRNGKLTRGINSTFIALIPKVDSPQKLNDFRPISLVGSIYKILAKVLANRLRLVIGSVIGEAQSAFVKDRQILDGILIANEVVDEAKKYKKELLLFKVDFEKAYDSVEWDYLDTVMRKMSFPTLWRKWIKECVGTATASVLVNGCPTDEFPMERGLRQGDPLSPFLFLLAAEGLNVMMKAMVHSNLFTGYSVGAAAPRVVSHLQFADDTLLMGVKSWANVRALRAVLVLFEAVSGLKVNFHKSMLVGVNIAESWLAEAASMLGCVVGKVPFVYLGLAIGGDPRRLAFWNPVLTRIKAKLSGWKSRFLSYGGRLILLKSVLTYLPVYALSFFKAPPGIISSIEALLNNFFWGGSEDHRKVSWIRWKNVCLGNEYGGLGVRHLREFNVALLGKWCWRLLVDRGGLWYKVLAARYGESGGRLVAGDRRGSQWWREVARIRDGENSIEGGWFAESIVRRVGNGEDTLFWTNLWLCDEPLSVLYSHLFELSANKSSTIAAMSELGWGEGGAAWQCRRQLRVWEQEELAECRGFIDDIVLQTNITDKWLWRHETGGGYTVRSAYLLLTARDYHVVDTTATLIWHKQVPVKVSVLAWRLLRNRLPTKDNLVARHIIPVDSQLCASGCGGLETVHHMFLSCPVFAPLWHLVRAWIGVSTADPDSLQDHLTQFSYSAGGARARRLFLQLIWLCCIWVIWNERNNRVFKAREASLHQLLDKVK
ncbi:cysteine-rich receptor-like protein kinase, partial [Trifolium medium]|nr:cysteine-rich receptor-like protein kinase [Trifolium medium]